MNLKDMRRETGDVNLKDVRRETGDENPKDMRHETGRGLASPGLCVSARVSRLASHVLPLVTDVATKRITA